LLKKKKKISVEQANMGIYFGHDNIKFEKLNWEKKD